MFVSIIICTYNRSESLRRTLDKISALIVPPGLEWEVLVVDNNSKDDTKAIVAQFNAKPHIRYLFEAKQGKSHALNLGMKEACGELFLFTDDDVDVAPDWLAKHADAASRYPNAAFFSGKVVPQWETPPPRWVEENSATVLAGVTVNYNRGTQEHQIPADECGGLGANLSLRKGVLEKAGVGFRKDLGPSGGEQVRFEEVMLLRQLMENGFPGIHIPSAVVFHRNVSERMTEKYVRDYLIGEGIALVRMGSVESSEHIWFGVPRYLWRKLLQSAVLYVLTRHTRPSTIWVRHECRMASSWGAIKELRRRR